MLLRTGRNFNGLDDLSDKQKLQKVAVEHS